MGSDRMYVSDIHDWIPGVAEVCDTSLETNVSKMLPRLLIYALILVLSTYTLLSAANAALASVGSHPALTYQTRSRSVYLDLVSQQRLGVDIYTEGKGRGQNVPIGTYIVGDVIKVFIFVSLNSTLTESLITPDGSVWLRMYGPVDNGTMIEYVDAQYPIGEWKISVKAETGTASASDTAAFEVVEKGPYTCVMTQPPGLVNATTIEEARFTGKVVRVYLYPVGGVYSWDVLVDRMHFGPEISNITVQVQLMGVTRMPNYPPGYVDHGIMLGDRVEVYGLVRREGNDTFVTLNGSENYYIKKSSTLCGSPEIILFTREVFAHNLTVRIDGIAVPGSLNATITSVTWSWGDGQSSSHRFPATHTYSKTGTYAVAVRALQSDGLSTIKSLSVSVPEDILSVHTRTTTLRSVTGSLTGAETVTKTETITKTTLEGDLPMTRELWAASLVAVTVAASLVTMVTMRRSRSKMQKENGRMVDAHWRRHTFGMSAFARIGLWGDNSCASQVVFRPS